MAKTKGFSKKQLRNVHPGAVVRVRWDDAPEELGMFLCWVNSLADSGDIEARVWFPARQRSDSYLLENTTLITHGQIIGFTCEGPTVSVSILNDRWLNENAFTI